MSRRTLSTLIKNVAAHSPCSLRPRAYRCDRAFEANIVKKRKTIAYPLSISLSLSLLFSFFPLFLFPISFPPSFKSITVLSLVPDPSALSYHPFHASNPFAQPRKPSLRKLDEYSCSRTTRSWLPSDISGNQLTRPKP